MMMMIMMTGTLKKKNRHSYGDIHTYIQTLESGFIFLHCDNVQRDFFNFCKLGIHLVGPLLECSLVLGTDEKGTINPISLPV